MKLPILDTYAFPVVLPSSGQTIHMRPYLVREEKLLLAAQASDDYNEHVEAVAQIIRNCTNDEVNPRLVPYFDIEYLLLQLRARSVGEIATPLYVCHHTPNGDDIECGHRTSVQVDLTKISVVGLDNRPPELFELKLSDRYTLHLKYPTVYTIHKLVISALNDAEINSEPFMEALCDVFDTLDDREASKTYTFMDYTTEEKMQFLESLSTRHYEELVGFLDTMPTVEHTLTFTCEKCQFTHTVELSGVTDFLG